MQIDSMTLYRNGGSLLHQMDARLKVGALAWFSIIMTIAGWSGLLLATQGMACLMVLSRLPWKIYLPVLMVTLWLALFYGLVSGWVWPSSWHFWQGHWSRVGLIATGYMIWKITLVFLGTRIFMAVTAPLEQGLGIAYFFGPLTLFTSKAADFALLLTLTLRFIPLLAEEASILWKARAVKGLWPQSRLARIREMANLFPPLLLVSLRRSEEVADNLLTRGYAPGHYRVMTMHTWTSRDTLAGVVFFLWGVGILVLRQR